MISYVPDAIDSSQIEEKLQQELDEVRTRHQAARIELEQMRGRARQLGLETPDRFPALRTAMRRHTHALAEYRKALHAFTDFVLRHKFPTK